MCQCNYNAGCPGRITKEMALNMVLRSDDSKDEKIERLTYHKNQGIKWKDPDTIKFFEDAITKLTTED